MDTGLSGASSLGLRMRKGSGGFKRSSRQPAHGQLLRRCCQVYSERWPSFHSMTRRVSPSLRRASGKSCCVGTTKSCHITKSKFQEPNKSKTSSHKPAPLDLWDIETWKFDFVWF